MEVRRITIYNADTVVQFEIRNLAQVLDPSDKLSRQSFFQKIGRQARIQDHHVTAVFDCAFWRLDRDLNLAFGVGYVISLAVKLDGDVSSRQQTLAKGPHVILIAELERRLQRFEVFSEFRSQETWQWI